MRRGTGRPKHARRITTTVAAALLLTTTPPASWAGTTTATSTTPTTLAYWNADMGEGGQGGVPSHWSASPARATATNAVRRVNAPAYFGSGVFALQLTDSSTRAATTARSAALNAVAGRNYTSNVNVFVTSGTAPTFYLEFLDAHGSVLGRRASTTTPPTPGHGRWMQAKGVAPAGTTSLRASFSTGVAVRSVASYRTPNITEDTPAQTYSPALGTGEVLFIGNERVASTTMTQVVHPGTKYDKDNDGRPDPVYDVKWSGRTRDSERYHAAQLNGTVVRDSVTGTYRMWFNGRDAATGSWGTWGSTSSDGVHWAWGTSERPGANIGGVVANPNTADTAHRYYMLATDGVLGAHTNPYSVVYRAYSSSDGSSWTPLSSTPVLPGRDVASVTYDPTTRRYIASTKQAGGTSDRRFFVSTSADFRHWSTPRLAFLTDPHDPSGSQVYAAPTFRYGAQLVGLPLIYSKAHGGTITPSLASSTDGSHFNRPIDRHTIIPLGSPRGSDESSDSGFIILPSGPVMDEHNQVALVNDRIRMYYTGWSGPHDTVSGRRPAIFMTQWRKDGFTSMHAEGSRSLTTRPLRTTGHSLVVNAALRSTGRLRVAVIDPTTGKAYPGFEDSASSVVTGDHIAATVTWGGKDLSSLAGRPIVLRFAVTDGDLYSFRVR